MLDNTKNITITYNREFTGWETITASYSVPTNFKEFNKGSLASLIDGSLGTLTKEACTDDTDSHSATTSYKNIKIMSVEKDIIDPKIKKIADDVAVLSFNDLDEITSIFDGFSEDDVITNKEIFSFHKVLVSQIKSHGDQPDGDFTAFESIEKANSALLSILPEYEVEEYFMKLQSES